MSEIIGMCGDCRNSGFYRDLWYDKDNVLHCRAYPDGLPAKVLERFEKTGKCPRKNKDMTEIFIARDLKKLKKEIEKEWKKIEEAEQKKKMKI